MHVLFHREGDVSPAFPRSIPPSTCLPPAKAVVSSYVLRIFSASITYEETTVRARPGQEENTGAELTDEENPERGNRKYHVRISD